MKKSPRKKKIHFNEAIHEISQYMWGKKVYFHFLCTIFKVNQVFTLAGFVNNDSDWLCWPQSLLRLEISGTLTG